MKKLLLTAAIALFAFTANAQDGSFKIGVNVGVPSGDVSDAFSFNAGLDVAYLIDVSDQFQVGGATGFNNFFGKDILGFKVDDFQFAPIAAAARYNVSDQIYLGADIGYAIALGDGDGGVYYRPRFGYSFSDKIGANISYSGISVDGGSIATFGIGFEYSL